VIKPSDLLLALAATPVVYAPVPASSSIGQTIDFTTVSRRFLVVDIRHADISSNPEAISVTGIYDDKSSLAVHSVDQDHLSQLAKTASLERQFESYFALNDNWDDQGATKPVHRTLRLGRNLMRWAAANGFVCARTYLSPNGEVGLVWEKDNGYADLSLADDGTVSFYIRDRYALRELYSEDRVPLAEVPGDFWLPASML
jgi:hypothetical protein